jgi:hypothetical protein
MSIFAFAALGAVGLGPVVGGWVEMNPRLGWRWIQWIHTMCVRLFYTHPPKPDELSSIAD